jgi:hypothetical protein
MATDTLADFPTDAATLDLLDAALNAPGGGLGSLLRFLSGHDPSRCEPAYAPADVIRALIARVRELEATQARSV